MGKFTILKDSRVDSLVEAHLKIAIKEINKIDGVRSIILVGGFGRGEGSILVEDKNIIPLNDYDIYLISDEDINEVVLNRTAIKIEKKVGSKGFSLYEVSAKDFYFDLRCIPIKKLNELPPFIKYYEMKHASMVIWGENYLDKIPDYLPGDLPISEGIRFILNRLSSIFLWNPYMPGRLNDWQDWEHRVFFYDISKLYIECCTILCQQSGIYAPTYRQRLLNLSKIWHLKYQGLEKEHPGLMKRIQKYTKMKLNPVLPNSPDYIQIWLLAKDDALAVLEFVLMAKFDLGLTDISSARFAYQYFFPYLRSILERRRLGAVPLIIYPAILASQLFLRFGWIKRLLGFNKLKSRQVFGWLDPGLTIFQSLVYLCQALKTDYYLVSDKLHKASTTLNKVYPVQNSVDSYRLFLGLYDDYVSAWKKYFFMKLTSI